MRYLVFIFASTVSFSPSPNASRRDSIFYNCYFEGYAQGGHVMMSIWSDGETTYFIDDAENRKRYSWSLPEGHQTMITFIFFAIWQPDPALTPGAIDESVTVEQLCKPNYTATVRNVTTSTKKKVVRAYRAAHPEWPPAPYEIDHFVSLEVGGSNDPSNLFPQPLSEARKKDVVENRAHRLLCSGDITIEQAQTMVRRWWFFLDDPASRP